MWLGFGIAILAAVVFFPLKHILVSSWMRGWFRRYGRDKLERDVLDMFDDPQSTDSPIERDCDPTRTDPKPK